MFPASQLEIQELPLATKNRLCILNDVFGLEAMVRSPGCTALLPRNFETLLLTSEPKQRAEPALSSLSLLDLHIKQREIALDSWQIRVPKYTVEPYLAAKRAHLVRSTASNVGSKPVTMRNPGGMIIAGSATSSVISDKHDVDTRDDRYRLGKRRSGLLLNELMPRIRMDDYIVHGKPVSTRREF
ncbi:hypothetical protein ARMGADRAFT_1024272 [Armillaria gallica]|uniref:Uncharacterized protein n=1 Tax=Armillaria gallica TaxID=47427 RepID=A0A2H3EGM7_ARMGA|nr:hypothetical protein ARMGADRAFT_1024272 [Armillaria gallica]